MNQPLFEIENLHKRFRRQVVLNGVSLTISKGESLVIVGQSGTGKSVLLKHLIRLIEPDKGRVLFEGQDLAKLRESEMVPVRRKIGMLFQSAALFDSMTVEENVALGLTEAREFTKEQIHEIVLEKLRLVDLADAARKEPSQLSGGMRKRVGLARAIATSPEVVLYDEPTTGLDPLTADVINDLIVNLNRTLNITSITVTHDMHSAFRIADRIVMLDEGKIVFDGTSEQFEASNDPIVASFLRASGLMTK
jgi:phospholipid/cholesterol/gamma-HCH transport system ATP-binding protein